MTDDLQAPQDNIPYVCNQDYPRLKDVFGSDEFVGGIEDIVNSMNNQMLYYAMGAKPPKTFLFYGPPGTGKTFTANAIGNELGALNNPKKVLWLPYNIGTHGTAYINMGSVNLQGVFDSGYDALTDPKFDVHSVIYFFDECDALMENRGNMHQSKEDKKLLETLMKNLQEINSRCTNEYIFLTTNFKESLDPASIRSGRIDRQIEFPLPDHRTRVSLFDAYIEKTNRLAQYKVIRNYNPENLASLSEGFNFADVEQVVVGALDAKIRKELRSKPKGIIPAYWVGEKGLISEIETIKQYKGVNQKKGQIGFMVDNNG